jgi:molybdopterin-guanine dinucleotide biosynthesis protein A
MTAVYRTRVHHEISRLVRNHDLRVSRLAEVLDAKRIEINRLKVVDPKLQSFLNINRLKDYRELLHSQSLEIPIRFRETE